MSPANPRRLDPPSSAAGEAWHALDVTRTAHKLGVDPQKGLETAEARRRLEQYGPNRLAEKPPPSPWRLFAAQFDSVFPLVLGGAALLALAIGHHLDALVILVVVTVNAVLGFLQERRAERAAAALAKMLGTRSDVRRNGEVKRIASARIVPGDVVLLDAGDRIPADGRLSAAHGLEIDESMLTGESAPVAKRAGIVLEPSVQLADRTNVAFMNTLVTRGRGELLATATGARTEVGRLAAMLEETEVSPTPLQIQLDRLGKRIAVVAGGAVAFVFGFGLLRGDALGDLALTSIALAVAAIPEGLPAVVTVTLALGMHRMARQRAIVKRLSAVETLGCTTLICSDKTGTLTRNRMTARAVFFRGERLAIDARGAWQDPAPLAEACGCPFAELEPLLCAVALCNDSSVNGAETIGDPTETALLELAIQGGLERSPLEQRLPRIAEQPFDPDTKMMITAHRTGEEVHLFVKGAPEVVLQHCSTILERSGEEPLDSGRGETIGRANEAFAADALRVLAVASRTLRASDFDASPDPGAHLRDLNFLGLVGLMDAPRPEVRRALALCRRAGIRVKMVTGDHLTTATVVARELGLEGAVVSGRELDAMDPRELADRFDSIGVFARVRPEHKVQLVRAAKACGHVVAMTGDGVNDAPALKRADIGIAMGRTGTEVAKEAASIVLSDDNFATIVGAVREGRAIYENIGKFVRFQLTTNFGAILSVFTAPLLGLPLPFNPIQILWVNIIMDGPPALALGVDPPSRGIMHQAPRRPEERILSLKRLLRLFAYGALMAAGTLGILLYGLQTGTPERALTLAFTTFVLFQFFNVFNVRSERESVLNRQLFRNRHLWLALAGVMILQLLATNWDPARHVFHTAELSAREFLLATGVAATILIPEELRKLRS